jgi:Mg2+ and Co2+ transporter CorA
MTNPGNINVKKLDEQIADIADQILETGNESILSDSNPDDEIARMQNTIISLKTAVKSAQPDEIIRARIHRNLLLAAQKENSNRKTLPVTRKIAGLALAGGFVLLVLVSLVLTPLYGMDIPLTGAAEGSPIWLPFAIIASIIIIVLIAWLNRQR